MMKKALVIVLCCFVTSKISSQIITNLDTADGLISNFVECIAVDGNGDVWIGTSVGLQKKAGNNWTTYNTIIYPGMADDNIKVVSTMSNGDVWIGTDYGASRFDGSTWTTYNTSNGLNNNQVKSIDEDITSGDVWIGTMTGVSYFNGSNWTVYSSPDLHWSGVNATAFDSNGDIWFGSPLGGITHYDGVIFTNYDTSNGLLSQNVTDLIIDSQNNKWVGTGGGVSILDATNSQFTHHTRMYLLPPPDTLNPVVNIASYGGMVWTAIYVGYLGVGGVACWDGVDWADYDYMSDGLAGPNIRGLAIDSDGWVWIATSTGISIIYDYMNNLESNFSEASFLVFPNPSQGRITLKAPEQIETIRLINNSGVLVLEKENTSTNQIDISLSHLSKGPYLFELKTKNNFYLQKIILQ